ncbi:hypothetical protein BASA61_008684 [Batrachochytrium salamandrivorans]|nr:hypothetical protein BASA61_008684 [Batrachochytrium salamandrivorans]
MSSRTNLEDMLHSDTNEHSATKPERIYRILPRSQALIYEVQIKEVFENTPKSPHVERVNCCFRILKDLIPQSGIFSEVFNVIMHELERSVFSYHITSSTEEPFIENIPYFSLMNRLDDARAIENSKTHALVEDLQQKLKFRDHDLTILYKKNIFLKQEICEWERREKALKEELAKLKTNIQQHEKEKSEIHLVTTRENETLQKTIEELRSSLSQSNDVIEKLAIFKATYSGSTESNKIEDEKSNTKHTLVMNSREMLSYDSYQAKKLQRQFAEVLDLQLDDYDSTLAQIHKKREIILSGSGDLRAESLDQESFENELENLSNGFISRIQSLLDELKLLDTHTKGLELVKSKLDSDKKDALLDRMGDISLRKYSGVMQYSTDGGQTFQTYSKINYCKKCGAKSVICPHRGVDSEIIALSEGCTHLRFIHPPLNLKASFNIEDECTKKVAGRTCFEESERIYETENKNVSKVFMRIWGDYYQERNGFKPQLNRTYTLQKLQSFIQEVYDIRWKLEEKYNESGIPDELGLPRFIANVVWKYCYMAKLLIYSKPEPMDMARYRHIVRIIYPDQPFYRCFQQLDYQNNGYLSYDDFDEALSQILPTVPIRERSVRYKLAELDGKKDAVELERLAHIAAYIMMYTCYKSEWANQSLISHDFIERVGSRDSKTGEYDLCFGY